MKRRIRDPVAMANRAPSIVAIVLSCFAPCAAHVLRTPPSLRPMQTMRTCAAHMAEKGLGGALGDALGGVARTALERIQDAASEAAMQEENPFLAERAPPVPLDPLSARELPDSFENAIDLAVEACAEALADGCSRLVVEFDTSAGDETYNLLSRTLKFLEPFLPLFTRSQDFGQPGSAPLRWQVDALTPSLTSSQS